MRFLLLLSFVLLWNIKIQTHAKSADELTLMLYQVDDRNSVIKILESKPNLEVILSDGIERIRLECRAPFPVQWIYNGAGVPTLSSTIRKESEGKFSATAFITSLKEYHTGKYDCASTENPEFVSAYYYIYVPGPSIFTTMGGSTIYIPKNDSHIRIPCGVSNPKVVVALEKSIGEVLVPVKSNTKSPAYSYDPKHGFDLDLANIQNPVGNYVCTGIGKGFRKAVEFNVGYHPKSQYNLGTYTSPPPTPSGIIDGQLKCSTHTDCPPNMSCYTDLTCKDPCVNSIVCGKGAICHYMDHRPRCECPSNSIGDPMKECISTDSTSSKDSQDKNKPPGDDPSVYFTPKTPTVPQPEVCRENKDCSKIQLCLKGQCIDPCALKICDNNAYCVSDENRVAMCVCNPGFSGQNGRDCSPGKLEVDPINLKIVKDASSCQDGYCGLNSDCTPLGGGRIECQCKYGFTGSPPKCQPKCLHNKDCEADTICRTNLGSYPECVEVCDERICGLNSECKTTNSTTEEDSTSSCFCKENFSGDPYTECKPISQGKDCMIDHECPFNERCETAATYRKCVNPCSRFECPFNTECKNINHRAICECPKGYTGSPSIGCTKDVAHSQNDFNFPLTVSTGSSILASTTTTETPYPDNNCTSINCGPNSECRIIEDIPKCFCQSNYIGSPPHCKLECNTNSDCPIDRACIQKRCRNPCRNKCGDNARCRITSDETREPICNCRYGFFGDPNVKCVPIREH